MLEDLVDQGYEFDEIRENVIQVLDPYFENKMVLEEYITHDQFLSFFSFIVLYHSDEIFSKYLLEVINCYRRAFKKDKEKTTEIILSTAELMSQKENIMWTVKNDIPNRVKGDIYDVVYSYMKYLGDSLEIGMKCKLAELYTILTISMGRGVTDYDKILNTKFGVIVQSLIDKKIFSSILITSFPKIRLSDWRNISYHSSYEIDGENIVCTYGRNNENFTLTVEKLENCTAEIIKFCNIIDIGRRIFIYDNMNSLDSLNEEQVEFDDRKDMKIKQLEISFLSQGFKIKKNEIGNQYVKIFITDLKRDGLSEEEEIKREIHCTQFLFKIWEKFSLENIEIIYSGKNEIELYKYSIDGSVFEKLLKEDFKLEKMIPFIKIEKLYD